MYTKLMSIICCLAITLPVVAQKNTRLTSPDGNIIFNCRLLNKVVVYNVVYKGKAIIDYSPVNLQFDNCSTTPAFKIDKPLFHDTTEDYELIVGKTKKVQAIISK